MEHNLDDIGGARELAWHRITVAKDDLEAACLALKFKAYKQHAQVIGNFN